MNIGSEPAPAPTVLLDNAAHLLIVDDDRRIRELLSRYLGAAGFRVTTANDAADAGRKLAGLEFDLLIVDVMMPGQSGVSFTLELRQQSEVPVLMLTALSETDRRIEGLEAGADDYLAKPFEPRELLLRINSILKRGRQEEPPVIEQVMFGPYTLSISRRELKRHGNPVRLTEREQEILCLFAANIGVTVPRHQLLIGDGASGERTVDVQINRLRRKIEEDPSDPKWLQTVRGVGYKLCVD